MEEVRNKNFINCSLQAYCVGDLKYSFYPQDKRRVSAITHDL
jgi:hypothetical protein